MVINTESIEALDTIEKMVKEFDIKVAIQDHPKRPNDPVKGIGTRTSCFPW